MGGIVAYLRSIKLPSVTTDTVTLPLPYGSLSRSARMLIALRIEMEANEETISRSLRLPPGHVDVFWTLVRKNRDAQSVIKRGLPAMYGEYLPDGIRVFCEQCGSLLRFVPCVRCCSHKQSMFDRADALLRDGFDIAPPAPTTPTMEFPGTDAKIEVMRQRVQSNLQPHHDEDLKFQYHE